MIHQLRAGAILVSIFGVCASGTIRSSNHPGDPWEAMLGTPKSVLPWGEISKNQAFEARLPRIGRGEVFAPGALQCPLHVRKNW
jgi:hypothetical protein